MVPPAQARPPADQPFEGQIELDIVVAGHDIAEFVVAQAEHEQLPPGAFAEGGGLEIPHAQAIFRQGVAAAPDEPRGEFPRQQRHGDRPAQLRIADFSGELKIFSVAQHRIVVFQQLC